MNKVLFSVLLMAATAVTQAQTRGTNAIGLGLSIQTNKEDFTNPTRTVTEKINTYTIGYGRFLEDSVKIGI